MAARDLQFYLVNRQMKDGNREGKPISKSNESRRKITEQAGYRTLKKSKLQQIEEKSNTTGIVIPKLAARNQQNREPPLLHLLGSEKELASIHQKARKKQQRSISVTPKEQVNHNQVNMQAKYTQKKQENQEKNYAQTSNSAPQQKNVQSPRNPFQGLKTKRGMGNIQEPVQGNQAGTTQSDKKKKNTFCPQNGHCLANPNR